jgi:hypothetical protein
VAAGVEAGGHEGRSYDPRLATELLRSLGFLLLAFSHYLLAVGLLLLLQPPEWRYLAAAELLLPGALAAAAIESWRFAGRSQGTSGSQWKPVSVPESG